jgi:cell division protein FtsB
VADRPTRRSGTRPAGRAGGAATGGARRTTTAGSRRTTGAVVGRTRRQAPSRRTTGLTTRAAVLGLIVCALVLALTYPLRSYFAQRAQIGELERSRQAAQRRVSELQARQQRWNDPAYVEAQARSRLRYVRPGEKAFIVIAPTPSPSPAANAVAPGAAADAPWYDRLWQTVEVAGEQPKGKPAR